MSLLTAPFWAVNLLIEGARATEEAAAAAATRILQKNVESRVQMHVYTQVHMHIVSILRFSSTFYGHQHTRPSHQQSPPAA